MGTRGTIGCELVLALLLLPGCAGYQMPGSNPGANDDLKNIVTKLVEKVDKDLSSIRSDAVEDRVRAGATDIKADRAIERLTNLERTVEATTERVRQEEISAAYTRNRVDQIETDVKTANQVAIDNANDNNELRKIVMDNLKKSRADLVPLVKKETDSPAPPSPSRATVVLENYMTTWKYVEVDGDGYWVAPLSYLKVNVPAGWATTRLVGDEAAKSWWLGAPNYSQRVWIKPQSDYQYQVAAMNP